MEGFLYNRDLRHERFKTLFTYIESLFLHVVKNNVLFFFFFFCFFYLAFLSRIFKIHRTAGEWEAISLYPFYHLHQLYRHLDISRVITAESSLLRIAGSPYQIWSLCYTFFRIHSFSTCTGSCCC